MLVSSIAKSVKFQNIILDLDPQQVPNSSSDSGIENTDSSTYDSNPVSSDSDLPIALRKKLEAVPNTHLPISSHSINYHINIKFF